MYDHEPEEVGVLRWEEFISRQREWIFAGYRSAVGLRRMGRRWSDLIEIGLGCPQDVADLLVRAEIIDRADRVLESTADSRALAREMIDVLAGLRIHLLEMAEIGHDRSDMSLEQHVRLLSFLRACAFGEDVDETQTSQR